MKILLICVFLDLFPIIIQKTLPSNNVSWLEKARVKGAELRVHPRTVNEAESAQFVREQRSFFLGDYVMKKPLEDDDNPRPIEQGILLYGQRLSHHKPPGRSKHRRSSNSYLDDDDLEKKDVNNLVLSPTNLDPDEAERLGTQAGASGRNVSRPFLNKLYKQGRYGFRGFRRYPGNFFMPRKTPYEESENISSPWNIEILYESPRFDPKRRNRYRQGRYKRYKRSEKRQLGTGYFQRDFLVGDPATGLFVPSHGWTADE